MTTGLTSPPAAWTLEGALSPRTRRRAGRAARRRALFPVLAPLADAVVITLVAVLAGLAYHRLILGEDPIHDNQVNIGLALALLMLLPALARGDYAITRYLSMAGHARRIIELWVSAFLALFALGFLTKTGVIYSRGTIVLLFLVGFPTLVAQRYLLVQLVRLGAKLGTVSARRVLLLGSEAAILEHVTRHQPWNEGVQIAGIAILPDDLGENRLRPALAAAAEQARDLRPDDVLVLVALDRPDIIETALEAMLVTPAAVHLAMPSALERYVGLGVDRLGQSATLRVARPPLSALDRALKRLVDVTLAGAGLIALLPLFALVALAIKLDSRGPVFFRQRRYGFNRESFVIWKFRSMRVLEDGRQIRQAQVDDPRITRVGRWLRRWNLDELPQLFNVLRGEMSLVGPRPHAVAHDDEYAQRISLYARRHNMKPGITGWAQIHGLRGETPDVGLMRKRIEHDLHYIDHWSLWLDFSILALTILSPRAYRGAR